MKIILFGATGMVGQGVLSACLADPAVQQVLSVSRTATGLTDPRLEEILLADVSQLERVEDRLTGADACFFPLGVSSAGMKEEAYRRITYTLTLDLAATLARLNPGMTFIYVSGQGTDSTEQGRSMWARVKGATENALLRLPLRAFLFRPGFIQPLDGIRSRTPLYRLVYALTAPLMPLLRWLAPNQILTTRQVGQAMLSVARHGYPTPILEIRDIRAVAGI
jgi:uncharacterized protein YbjT (DUF2867 family)